MQKPLQPEPMARLDAEGTRDLAHAGMAALCQFLRDIGEDRVPVGFGVMGMCLRVISGQMGCGTCFAQGRGPRHR